MDPAFLVVEWKLLKPGLMLDRKLYKIFFWGELP